VIYIDCEYADINQDRIMSLIEYILSYFNLKNKEISVSFVSDSEMKELNFSYRKINEPTDVLSFALSEGEDMCDDTMLGDIVVSYDTATKQANVLNHPFLIEIDHLICHGMLHLLGFDHINECDKNVMFKQHKKILTDFYNKINDLKYINDNWLLSD